MRHTIWMLGLSLALSGLAARADEVPILQPETPLTPMERVQVQPRKAVAELGADGSLRVKAQDAQVVDIIGEIAAKGKLQVLVATDVSGKLPWFALGAPAEAVLRGLCDRAHLEVLRYGDAFLVRLPRADAPEPVWRPGDPTYSLKFREVQTRDIIELLAVQNESGTVVQVEDALNDKKIPVIKLQDVSFKAALEAVARALDADLTWKEGRYVLSAKPKQSRKYLHIKTPRESSSRGVLLTDSRLQL